MAQPTLIGSVQRALRLLEAVAASEDVLSAKRLARMVGLPLPTAYHLLRTLVHEGYLRKLDEGYVLGEAARPHDAPGLQAQLPQIRAVLRSLRDEVRGATYLSVFSEGRSAWSTSPRAPMHRASTCGSGCTTRGMRPPSASASLPGCRWSSAWTTSIATNSTT
ncbi:helix-turn-helix domain-containing protein [Nocardioides alcanivorans]|uniref:helix-turn-helix domain-containing protein n=1 Tax=Nocardioides alcanivorans TaxID=2897352 RepID=UPI001F3B40F8|nr:helix-turn-helix domain-containing protein [Nocardioides alcanivorans]